MRQIHAHQIKRSASISVLAVKQCVVLLPKQTINFKLAIPVVILLVIQRCLFAIVPRPTPPTAAAPPSSASRWIIESLHFLSFVSFAKNRPSSARPQEHLDAMRGGIMWASEWPGPERRLNANDCGSLIHPPTTSALIWNQSPPGVKTFLPFILLDGGGGGLHPHPAWLDRI